MLSRNVFGRWVINLESQVGENSSRWGKCVFRHLLPYHARILPLRNGGEEIKEKRSQVFFKDYRSPELLGILKPYCVFNTKRGQSQRSAIIWEAMASCISPPMNSKGEKEPFHVLGSALKGTQDAQRVDHSREHVTTRKETLRAP